MVIKPVGCSPGCGPPQSLSAPAQRVRAKSFLQVSPWVTRLNRRSWAFLAEGASHAQSTSHSRSATVSGRFSAKRRQVRAFSANFLKSMHSSLLALANAQARPEYSVFEKRCSQTFQAVHSGARWRRRGTFVTENTLVAVRAVYGTSFLDCCQQKPQLAPLYGCAQEIAVNAAPVTGQSRHAADENILPADRQRCLPQGYLSRKK